MKKIRTRGGVLSVWSRAAEKNDQRPYESLQKDREQHLTRRMLPAFVPQPRYGDDGPGNRWSQLRAA